MTNDVLQDRRAQAIKFARAQVNDAKAMRKRRPRDAAERAKLAIDTLLAHAPDAVKEYEAEVADILRLRVLPKSLVRCPRSERCR